MHGNMVSFVNIYFSMFIFFCLMHVSKQELVICHIKQREEFWQLRKIPNSLLKLLDYCLNLVKWRPVTG